MNRKYLAIIFALLTIAVTGYIFSNSLKDADASHAQSDVVVEVVAPILTPVIPQTREPSSERDLSFWVRKTAHFTEFALLGFCAGCCVVLLSDRKRTRLLAGAATYCLCVACCDEWIQSFRDRTSSWKDVALDFGGAIFGVLIVAAVVWLLYHKRGGNAQCPN